jgi:phosphocarrier protein
VSDGQLVERTVEIVNRAGMHARPAAELVKLAGRFTADIRLEKDGLEVNGKSIMGVLMLAAEHGSTLRLTAEGADAADAVDALSDLVIRGFEELEA